jgi:phosphoribosylglycinamide formyltransferase 2
MLLGSGELGKEVAIECQRLGIEVIAVDRYADAPAMQVVHRSHVINMLDGEALKALVAKEKPHFIVPEIEAIATDALIELEAAGQRVVPCARATKLTMNREGIRRLAAEELQLPTSSYRFADSEESFRQAVGEIGLPCIVKPVMSSSGKGQSFIKSADQLASAWAYAQQGGRAGAGRVIVEGVVKFDFEITLLTISAVDGVHFCAPVGHRQEDGDYRESWQPQQMSAAALERARQIAREVVLALGGHGLFGVELFVCGDEVIFSEVSPRPHDTGMVTLISQDLSEFALHVRAFLGLPIGAIRQYGPAASAVILPQLHSQNVTFDNLHHAVGAGVQLRLFGKPEIEGSRRLGVALAVAEDVESAVERAVAAVAAVQVNG